MADNDFIRLPETLELVELSPVTVRRMWRRGEFPRPTVRGYKKQFFRKADVEEWLAVGREEWARRRTDKQSAA